MRTGLLLLVAAVMCCATNVWALSGTGTEDDPYVVADGETFTMKAEATTYISFTAPSNGTLTLIQSAYGMAGWMVKGPNDADYGQYPSMSENYGEAKSTAFAGMESGATYLIKNNGTFWADEAITVSFEGAGADALDVVSAVPAEGSAVAAITTDSPIKITLNKAVGYVMAEIQGGDLWSSFEAVMAIEGSAATDTWNLVPFVDTELYEGTTYTVTIKGYATYDDWFNEGNPSATPAEITTITYEGATEAVQYATAKLVSITPDPTNETDFENMLSTDGITSFTATFSEPVKAVSCNIALGSGGSIEVPTSGDGTTTITGDLSGILSSSDYILSLVLQVTDTEGRLLLDENPAVEGVTFWNNSYSFDLPVADGRTVDALLTASDIEPANGSFVASIDKVTFTMNGAADQDKFYGRTFKANAGIYDAEGEKIYDVLLTQDDERGAVEFTPTGQQTEYVPGTTSYFIATICELGTVNYDNVEAAVPATITEPGAYTLKIAEQSIGDGNFDANSPWLSALGGPKGRCNPELNWTYTIVGEIVEVESVNPAPYNTNGGVFNDEIPAEIKVTMSSANFTVAAATVRYGMNTREVATTSVEGNVLTISGISEAAQAAGQATVMISATSTDGAPIVYGASEDDGDIILLTYQKDRATFVPVSMDPEEGSVESLETITLTMSEEVGNIDYGKTVVVKDQAGNETVCSMDYDWEIYENVIITLDDPITAEGIYTLVIPEGAIYNMTSYFGFVDQYGTPICDYYNPELEYRFTIGNPDSIENVAADEANRIVKAYTVSGVCVGEGTVAELKDMLPAGIYIMDGQKVAVMK